MSAFDQYIVEADGVEDAVVIASVLCEEERSPFPALRCGATP